MAELDDYKIKTDAGVFKLQHLPPRFSEEDNERLLHLHKRLAEMRAEHRAAIQPIWDEMVRISAKYPPGPIVMIKE
jgi:hypothetical protein